MDSEEARATLPDVDIFVDELMSRAKTGFPATIRCIAGALIHAGGSQEDCVRLEAGILSRPAYTLACCAEEIASIHGLVERYRERIFAHACLERLQPMLSPLDPTRAGLDFHRLYADFKVQPARTRTRLVEYLLEVNDIRQLKRLVEADSVCQVAIEMSASRDGLGGILSTMVLRKPSDAEPADSSLPGGRHL